MYLETAQSNNVVSSTHQPITKNQLTKIPRLKKPKVRTAASSLKQTVDPLNSEAATYVIVQTTRKARNYTSTMPQIKKMGVTKVMIPWMRERLIMKKNLCTTQLMKWYQCVQVVWCKTIRGRTQSEHSEHVGKTMLRRVG